MSVLEKLHLVPLDCPSCGESVEAEGADVVYYCTACRNGYRFSEGEQALVPTEVSFVSTPNLAAELYLPFWLLPARVEIHERVAKPKNQATAVARHIVSDGAADDNLRKLQLGYVERDRSTEERLITGEQTIEGVEL